MNKNQKNKKILFTLLLTLTFVVGLIPLGIRGANADELTEPLEQMVISTTGEQLNDVEVSVPDEGESSEKNDQEIEVENSEVPEKEALEPNETKEEEKPVEETPPVVEEKPAEETPPVVEEKPAEEAPPLVEEKPAEETPPVVEEKPAEEAPPLVEEKPEVPPVEEKEPIEEPVKLEKDPEKNTIAEYAPPVLEQPKIVLPNSYYQGFNVNTTPLEDTIKVDKIAERSPGCRKYEVTLSITGTPPKRPVDVVLVIDTSGSMAKGEDNYAYEAITSSPDTKSSYYVKIGNSYQLVRYDSGNWRYISYYNIWNNPVYRFVKWDKDGDDNGPGNSNSNNPLGKPFYDRFGLSRMYYAKKAAANFANKVLGIDGNRVSIVSYSGPETTNDNGAQKQAETIKPLTANLSEVNAAINSLNAVGGTNTEAGFLEAKSVIEGSDRPNSKKVVIMFTDGLPTASNGKKYADASTDITTVHNQRALAAGKSIFGQGHTFTNSGQEPTPKYHINPKFVADVFTIGLLEGMNTAEKKLAIDILEQTNNKEFYEAPTAAELDKILQAISEKLDFSAENAVVVDKIGENFNLVEPLPYGATYNSETKEITWKAGTIVKGKEYKYIVQAKPEFKGGEEAYTNEFATLTYTDVFGNPGKTKNFPKPEVYVPTPLRISLTDAYINLGDSIELGTGTNPDGENYMSPLTDGDGETFTYEWRLVGDDTIISTAQNPKVSPTVPTHYEVTVTDSYGCKVKATMTVTPVRSVTATKEWVKGPDKHPPVWFKLFWKIDGGKLVEVPGAPIKELKNNNTTATWTGLDIVDSNGKPYIYSVKEGQYDGTNFKEGAPEHYTVAYSKDGLTVTNTYALTTVIVSKTVEGTLGDRSKPFSFKATLSNGAKFPDFDASETTFTLKHGDSVKLSVPIGASLSIVETNNEGYTVKVEHEGNSFNDPEIKVTIPTKETTIKFTNTKNAVIDTGIALDSLPYLLILVLLAIGGVGRLIWKRNQRELD